MAGIEFSTSWVDDAVRDFPPIATIAETVKYLRISERDFYRAVAAGRIKTIRRNGPGSRVIVPRASVREYLAALAEASR
jgi:excisionase family DNA binding protein